MKKEQIIILKVINMIFDIEIDLENSNVKNWKYMALFQFTKYDNFTKGQIISKRLFLSEDSPKNEQKHVAY